MPAAKWVCRTRVRSSLRGGVMRFDRLDTCSEHGPSRRPTRPWARPTRARVAASARRWRTRCTRGPRPCRALEPGAHAGPRRARAARQPTACLPRRRSRPRRAVEVHGAPPPTLNFDGTDPYEVRGTLFEARAPAPHPPDHVITHAAAVRSVEHSFCHAARRPDGRSASGAGGFAPSIPAPDGSPASARALPAPICEPRAKS